jgi:Flp pilus assembly protein TadD
MDRVLLGCAVLAMTGLLVSACSSTDMPDALALTGPAASKGSADQQNGANAGLPTADLDTELRKAKAMRANGDLQGAGRVLAQLMLASPDDPRIVGEYGKTLAEQGHTGDAKAFLERAVQLQPNDWTLYSALGVTYDQMDKHAQAQSAYNHALRLKPGEPSVLNNYAVSQMLAGNLAAAQTMLAQAQSGVKASGGDNTKIAGNLAMVASLRGDKAAPASSAAIASATNAAPTARVQSTPMAAPQPAAPQNTAPRQLQRPQAPASHAPRSVASLKANPQVVMQRVPFDSLAGPVGKAKLAAKQAPQQASRQANGEPHKLADASSLRSASKRVAAKAPPSLRTASD